MATFGQTSTLSNAFSIGLNYIGCRFQAPANGTVTDIRAHLIKNFGGTVPAYAAMYTDNAGAPDALMFYTASTTVTGTGQFYTFSGGTTVTTRDIVSGQYYWLSVWTDDAGTCDFRYDTGLTDQFATTSNNPTFPTFNDPWGTPSYSSVEVSIYATYTPAGTIHTQNLSDTTTLTDTNTKAFTSVRSDSVTLSDANTKAFSSSRSDSVTLSDSNIKQFNSLRADSVSFADSLAKAISKAISDNVPLSDALTKAAGKTIEDLITLSDIASPLATLVLNLGDGITLSDSLAKQLAATIADSVGLSDSQVKQLEKSLTDTTTLTDSRTGTVNKTFADSLILVDSLSTSTGGGRTKSMALLGVG